MDIKQELLAWLNKIENFKFPEWNEIPDLGLYMDQVLTLLEKKGLSDLVIEDEDKSITASMINNYVKGGLIPSPVSKKYSRDHLAYIFFISSLKQVLTISEIKELKELAKSDNKITKSISDEERIMILYDQVNNFHASEFNKIATSLSKDIVDNDDELFTYAFRLVVEAEIKKLMARKILALYRQKDNEVTPREMTEKEILKELLKNEKKNMKNSK